MYQVRNASGGAKLNDLFFYLSVILGAFFVLNLMIAVQFNFLNEAFEEDHNGASVGNIIHVSTQVVAGINYKIVF